MAEKEYIDREAAINAVFEAFADGRSTYIALEALPAADVRPVEWIPVTERLPLYGQDVLAVRTYGDGEKCQEVLMAHIAVWDEGTGEKWWNATNITHWMSLPEPPKEE